MITRCDLSATNSLIHILALSSSHNNVTKDVAATGCAKYMRNNLNETVREELFIRIQ